MKSIFHINANTPEDFRKELVRWLESSQIHEENYRDTVARTKKDIQLANARSYVYRNAAAFWTEIIIDPKPELGGSKE